ncbi:unnamed protein product [Ascophyllum nodosum]
MWSFCSNSRSFQLILSTQFPRKVRMLGGFGRLCVCVFFPSILDIKFVGRTSRGHTGGRSQDF